MGRLPFLRLVPKKPMKSGGVWHLEDCLEMIRWLSEISSKDTQLVGGKAANLGELLRHRFPVPKGFVITVDVYATYSTLLTLNPRVLSAVKERDWESAEKEAAAIFLSHPMRPEWKQPIANAYREMGSPAVAVRSSATAEDAATDSFAGQYDTFLNIIGEADLMTAITKCWLSNWNQRSLSYRFQRSVDPFTVKMAVIVQEMVTPDFSGVLFTVNPLTGDRDQIHLEIVPGLGEALVSGEKAGDVYRLQRSTMEVVERDGQQAPLTEPALRRLFEMALKAEQLLSCPQDIEFAIDRDRIHILQSRPISTLTDGGPEDLPPLPPSSWFDRIIKPIGDERYVIAPKPLDNLVFTRLVGALMYSVRKGGIVIRKTDEEKFRQQMWHQAYRLPKVRLTPRALFPLPAQVRLLKKDWLGWWNASPSRLLDDVTSPLELRELIDAQLFERANRILEAWEEPLNKRFWAATAAWAEPWLKRILLLVLGRRKSDSCLADLMSGTETSTGKMNEDLWHLSRLIRESELSAAIDDFDRMRLRGLPGGQEFLAAFDEFLIRHGHREGTCYFLSTPVWRNDPGPVYRLLQSLAKVESRPDDLEQSKSRYRAARRTVENRLRFIPGLLHIFRWLLERLRAIQVFREESHSDIMKPIAALQDLAIEWGRRLHERGLIEKPDDAFYLTYEEIESWLTGPGPSREEVRILVSQRRATYKMVAARWQAERFSERDVTSDLRGIGVSPGAAQGKVRIIEHPGQFDLLKPGEILVCTSTNPSWTPLFHTAAAVVAETGGTASHAAIVAREYRIPAVMNVRGATRKLNTGDSVIVDASSGKIRKVAAAATDKPWTEAPAPCGRS